MGRKARGSSHWQDRRAQPGAWTLPEGCALDPCLTALADGFDFDFELRYDLEEDEFGDPFFFDPHQRRRRRASGVGLEPELLRFGIQFSDGRKTTNVESRFPFAPPGADESAERLVLMPRGGGGGGGTWTQEFRISPLPPAGPLAFVCEWPVADIPETRKEIDSALVREAAGAAAFLWGESDTRGDSGSWTTHQVELRPEDPEPPDPAS